MEQISKNKIEIIDKICLQHPSLGVEKGWSEYVGGMKDSGQWFFRKMLDAPIEELELFLNGIIEIQNKVSTPKEYTQEEIKDMKTYHINGSGILYTEYFRKQIVLFKQKMNAELIHGLLNKD